MRIVSNPNAAATKDVQFGEVTTADGHVSVPLQEPLRVVTGPAVVASAPVDDDGSAQPFLNVKLATLTDKRFFEAFEARVVDAAVENRKVWFGKGVDADQVSASLKSFVRDDGEGTTLRLRLLPDVQAFDDAGRATDIATLAAGDRVRLLAEARAVRLGRNEFGCVWTARQLRCEPQPECLIQPDGGAGAGDNDEWAWIV